MTSSQPPPPPPSRLRFYIGRHLPTTSNNITITTTPPSSLLRRRLSPLHLPICTFDVVHPHHTSPYAPPSLPSRGRHPKFPMLEKTSIDTSLAPSKDLSFNQFEEPKEESRRDREEVTTYKAHAFSHPQRSHHPPLTRCNVKSFKGHICTTQQNPQHSRTLPDWQEARFEGGEVETWVDRRGGWSREVAMVVVWVEGGGGCGVQGVQGGGGGTWRGENGEVAKVTVTMSSGEVMGGGGRGSM